jgi:hypothetical protein
MLRRIALVTAATAVLPTVALAASPPLYDLWQGPAGKTNTVSIVREVGKKATTASISYQCTVDGVAQTFTSDLSGKSKGNKLKLKGPASTSGGKATLTAKLKTKRAKGKFTVSLPVGSSEATCKVSHKFSLKGIQTSGG